MVQKFIINAQYGKVMASRNKIEVKFLKCDQVQGVELWSQGELALKSSYLEVNSTFGGLVLTLSSTH